MNIIAGDSWGCGEWSIECTNILHSGLEQYFHDDGYSVVNLSKGGISNLDIVERLNIYFERYPALKETKIFVFQTEYSRDFKHDVMQKTFNVDDWKNLQSVTDLSSKWIERFYTRLSEVAQKNNSRIYIIGGASDTLWFDNMELDYPGCQIACQSLTNLLINNSHRIENPVFCWYGNNTESLVQKLRKILPDSGIKELLTLINQGIDREATTNESPNLFFPDGIHPNRKGHLLLYNFLKEQKIFE